MKKQHLIGLTPGELEQIVMNTGEPRFRADQLLTWIYKKRSINFDEMTNIAKAFQLTLNKNFTIGIVSPVKVVSSQDKSTHKFLFRMEDGLCIESVFMIENKRRTVCLSSQVGCALNCNFCATGKMGFKRDLYAGEIIDQLIFMSRYLNKGVTNVVIMGMGEPFLNYDNVLKACDIISNDRCIAIGKRKITISTSGIIPAIKRFADDGHKYKLAISLNSANNNVRSQLMPVNKKYPVRELMNAARYYFNKTKRKVTFEYVLIHGLNDSHEDAEALRHLIHDLPCKINIIPHNKTDDKHHRSEENVINDFIKPFLSMNVAISVRRSKGVEIDAACGQLYYNVLHNKSRLPE